MPRRSTHVKNPKKVAAAKHPSQAQMRARADFSRKAKQAGQLIRQGYTKKQAWASLR